MFLLYVCLLKFLIFFSHAESKTDSAIQILRDKGVIQIANGSPFLNHLKSVKVSPASEKVPIKEKGLVVGIKGSEDWKFLNEESQALFESKIRESIDKKANTLVRARLSRELITHIKYGDKVGIAKDNFASSDKMAKVEYAGNFKNSDLLEVYVSFEANQPPNLNDFFWIDFRFKEVKLYFIPTKALLYIFNEEYVLKKSGENTFIPKNVSVVTQNKKGVLVFGGLSNGDEVLSDGAILLKPIVEQFVEPTYEAIE